MPVRKILPLVFPTACMVCLAAGFASVGRWIALPFVFAAGLTWLAAGKWRFGFLASAALMFSVGLAAAGSLLSVPSVLMMLGAAFALAGWDVLLFRCSLADAPSAPAARRLEARHYQSLALALGIGLTAAAAGPFFRIRISFGWMLALAILALTGLDGLLRILGERRK